MKHSKLASGLVLLAMICAFVGFLDATYLTANHLAGKVPPCTVAGACDRVLASEFSHVGAIPVAAGGMLFYLAAILLGTRYIDSKSRKALGAMLVCATLGVAVSAVMVYIQLGVLHSVCAYCMVSAVSSVAFATCILWAAIFHRSPQATSARA